MKLSRKKAWLLVIPLILIVVGYFAISPLLSIIIKNKLESTIEKLREDGIDITYDSLTTQPDEIVFARLLAIKQNDAAGNCSNRDTIKIERLVISGLKIIPLVLRRSIRLNSIQVTHPYVRQTMADKKDDAGDNQQEGKIKNISVDHIRVDSAHIMLNDSSGCKTSMILNFTGELHSLLLANLDQPSIHWQIDETSVSSIVAKLPQDFYTIAVTNASYHADEKTFSIDSINIKPDYNKSLFSQKSDRQVDRIEGYASSIRGNDFELSSTDDKTNLYAKNIHLTFHFDIFRDKRYPFKNKLKPLPVTFLHDLPIKIQIDTLYANNCYVSYEEFQEDGTEPGKVFFDDLNCRIENISNQSKKETVMKASTKFMDDGLLRATFTFPAKPDANYTVSGTVKNFSLPSVNPMLTTAAHAEIETGTLEEMRFRFSYNDTRADGKLELNYKDLKMISLLKDKEKKNKFLTFIIGLVVKEDMDKNLPTDKKTGEILFYRDKRKSIFNYWWKSILTGIKSVYNLDRIQKPDRKN